MKGRWRARSVGLAIILSVTAIAALTWTAVSADGRTAIVIRLPDGTELERLTLDEGDGFALRYRNSLYRSLAEERFEITANGQIHLVELAADELAVLEEYYAIDEPARPARPGDARAWVAEPAIEVALTSLTVAATDLGERTLLAGNRPPLELWRLVEDGAASVVVEVDAP